MRKLSSDEIINLTTIQRCWAEDWNKILVADDFVPANVRNTNFYGYVKIGSGVSLTDVKIIKGSGQPYKPNVISVLNEGGDGNVILCKELTAQLAYLMIHYKSIFEYVYAEISKQSDIQYTEIGNGCVIEGASRIVDSVIDSSVSVPTTIGADVILYKSVVAVGAEIVDAAKVYESFVGEAVHIGKGFSSEASLFFANAYMDNGEACAALCGPFACSHHKSTLLIGGEFSFYNAGSNTNQSNHAYKMGPIHWGTLQRGAKTASGCHILWPATIGIFSMVMGKLTQHPDLSDLPFSYVIGDSNNTYIIPGINIRTVGTWRDINKWPKRDSRKSGAMRDLISFDFPNPIMLQAVRNGKKILQELQTTQGNCEEYLYQKCFIKKRALEKGIAYYELAEALCGNGWGKDEYIDVLGFIVRLSDIEAIIKKVESSDINSISNIIDFITSIRQDYTLSEIDTKAYDKWLHLVEEDARKEFDMGDVSEEQLEEFVKGVKWRTSTHLYHNNN